MEQKMEDVDVLSPPAATSQCLQAQSITHDELEKLKNPSNFKKNLNLMVITSTNEKIPINNFKFFSSLEDDDEEVEKDEKISEYKIFTHGLENFVCLYTCPSERKQDRTPVLIYHVFTIISNKLERFHNEHRKSMFDIFRTNYDWILDYNELEENFEYYIDKNDRKSMNIIWNTYFYAILRYAQVEDDTTSDFRIKAYKRVSWKNRITAFFFTLIIWSITSRPVKFVATSATAIAFSKMVDVASDPKSYTKTVKRIKKGYGDTWYNWVLPGRTEQVNIPNPTEVKKFNTAFAYASVGLLNNVVLNSFFQQMLKQLPVDQGFKSTQETLAIWFEKVGVLRHVGNNFLTFIFSLIKAVWSLTLGGGWKIVKKMWSKKKQQKVEENAGELVTIVYEVDEAYDGPDGPDVYTVIEESKTFGCNNTPTIFNSRINFL